MYSKARIAGHAIHPMLVGFPLALFTATIGLELAYIGTQDIFYFRAAMVANMIIAPNEAAELFSIWIAAGAVIFLSVVASSAVSD